ncbi:hypothetical protein AUC68_00365 [Methyloceanibacter methanicus]|uniref:Uncharacterized protein n=1 Tax=Methyloceanibacter methanicus TaxID=1774968 RepID=A0A1E3W6D3_9HYPH|nr:hypothetical protein AUC68_00365 [Methyloceanibacter methanicus]
MSPILFSLSFGPGWRGNKALLLLAAGLLIGAIDVSDASARQVLCYPKDVDPQILRSPRAGDYLPNWAPPSGVGTGWSFTKVSRTGAFLKGVLNTSRGNPTTGTIYVVAAEWHCD